MKSFLLLAFILGSSKSWAWSEHHLITQAALSTVLGLQSKTVIPTSFDDMIHALGYSSPLDFNEKIQIKKEYSFQFKLGETLSAPLRVVDILAKYSDEPDWTMDQDLFGSSEYPELWRAEYAYMGGNKTGTPTQAFRHMYWEKLSFPHLMATFKLPDPLPAMGEAPVRAALFIDLARKAKQKGYNYWAARFVANALHYLEDVSQPYHSTQVQTPSFYFVPFDPKYYFGDKDYKENVSKNYVGKVTNVVSYYHFAFEEYVAHVMLNENPQTSVSAHFFNEILATKPSKIDSAFIHGYDSKNMANLVMAMSHYSAVKAFTAATASMEFFPNFATYLQKNHQHLDEFNPDAVIDQNWYNRVDKSSLLNSPAKQKYFNTVSTIFSQLGENIRAVVNGELN